MKLFREDNTDGYTRDELDALNAEWEQRAILGGYDAIDYAEANGLLLNKYNDPIEEARTGLSLDEARDIASEDASLIWVKLISGTDEYDASAKALSDEIARR